MTVPVGVDPVLWQQAVRTAGQVLCGHRFGGPGHACAYHRERAAFALAAAFGVLQQATRQQIERETMDMAEKIQAYSNTREPLCPRCMHPRRDLPTCATSGFRHDETCSRYRWAAEVCAECDGDFGPVVARGETPEATDGAI